MSLLCVGKVYYIHTKPATTGVFNFNWFWLEYYRVGGDDLNKCRVYVLPVIGLDDSVTLIDIKTSKYYSNGIGVDGILCPFTAGDG